MKKVLSVVLALAMVLVMVPMASFTAQAAISPNQVKTQLDSLKAMNAYKPGNKNPPSSEYRSGTSGCFGFVDLLCRKIFGHNLASQKSHMELYTTNLSKIGSTLSNNAKNLSDSSLQTLLSMAKTGDIVQMDYTPYGGGDSLHTMMV